MTTIGPVLVTGATGLLGSHLVQRLRDQGRQVRALVRPGSDVRFLQAHQVELVRGDLTSTEDCHGATQGVDIVFHSAAKVGDWGDWAEFQVGCLDSTRQLAEASVESGVSRFIHISSTSAYGHPTEGGPPVAEDAPLGQNLWWAWDYYTRSKVECERLLWDLADTRSLPLTVIRPSWLYGERDRTTTSRLMGRIRSGGIPLIGRGTNPLSAIYAGEVARAAILASEHPASAGHAYNVTDLGSITQQGFFDLWAEAAGHPPTHKQIPYRSVFAAAFAFEAWGRLLRSTRPPAITRYATWLMGRNLAYSTQKIRDTLGWTPSITYKDSIDRTVRWFEGNQGRPNRDPESRAIRS